MRAVFLFVLLHCALFAPLSFANNEDDVQLLSAAAEGNLERVKFLVEEMRTDIDNTRGSLGMTALHYALSNDKMPQKQCEVVRYLIGKSANQDIKAGPRNLSAKEMIAIGYCKGKL